MGTKTELKGEKKRGKKGRNQKEGKTAEWKNQFKKRAGRAAAENLWGRGVGGRLLRNNFESVYEGLRPNSVFNLGSECWGEYFKELQL